MAPGEDYDDETDVIDEGVVLTLIIMIMVMMVLTLMIMIMAMTLTPLLVFLMKITNYVVYHKKDNIYQ